MSDLISRQNAIDAFEKELSAKYNSRELAISFVGIKSILENLPSAQPEQTDCEYCHEDSDGYVRPIEKNSHAWLVRRWGDLKLRVGFKGGYSECDILFCPMCGRRLADG